jgi:integrase
MASIFRQRYTVKDGSGKRIRKQSQYWYIDYKTADGTRKRIKGFKDKTATTQLAAQLEREAEQAQVGIIDRYKEHRKRPLAEHIEDFEQSLLAKGGTAKNAKQVKTRVKRIFEECKFTFWDDIQASKVQHAVSGLRKQVEVVKTEVIGGEKVKKKELKDLGEISAQTYNFYLKAVKQFCKWMVQDGRASESPVEHLQTINVRADRRHDRRALELDEIRKLLEATKAAPMRFGMTGHQRATLYRLAIETGLRANELRSLTASSFDFENCSVMVEAAYSKNRKQSILPLRKDTAAELQSFMAGKLPNVQMFNMPEKTAEMLKADLEAVKIPYVDDAGRYCDFHSLRHSTGSLLVASGAHPKVVQSIMRHSDINLTMSRYTHIFRGQESEAVAGLPDLSLPSSKTQKATGTDELPVDGAYKPAYKKLAKNPYFNSAPLSPIGHDGAQEKFCNKKTTEQIKSLQMAGLGTEKELMSPNNISEKSNTPDRIRTCDLRFRKPTLYPTELRAQLKIAFLITLR